MPPQGLTSELWWLGTKLARSAISRTLPLVDGAQVPFRISISDSMQRRLHYIDREAAGAIRGTDGANDGFQNKFLIRSLIEEAMTSSQLEGAATTRVVAKEMLSTGRAPRDHSERMIYNNSVSYTHLDLYKRQLQVHERERIAAAEMLGHAQLRHALVGAVFQVLAHVLDRQPRDAAAQRVLREGDFAVCLLYTSRCV